MIRLEFWLNLWNDLLLTYVLNPTITFFHFQGCWKFSVLHKEWLRWEPRLVSPSPVQVQHCRQQPRHPATVVADGWQWQHQGTLAIQLSHCRLDVCWSLLQVLRQIQCKYLLSLHSDPPYRPALPARLTDPPYRPALLTRLTDPPYWPGPACHLFVCISLSHHLFLSPRLRIYK